MGVWAARSTDEGAAGCGGISRMWGRKVKLGLGYAARSMLRRRRALRSGQSRIIESTDSLAIPPTRRRYTRLTWRADPVPPLLRITDGSGAALGAVLPALGNTAVPVPCGRRLPTAGRRCRRCPLLVQTNRMDTGRSTASTAWHSVDRHALQRIHPGKYQWSTDRWQYAPWQQLQAQAAGNERARGGRCPRRWQSQSGLPRAVVVAGQVVAVAQPEARSFPLACSR